MVQVVYVWGFALNCMYPVVFWTPGFKVSLRLYDLLLAALVGQSSSDRWPAYALLRCGESMSVCIVCKFHLPITGIGELITVPNTRFYKITVLIHQVLLTEWLSQKYMNRRHSLVKYFFQSGFIQVLLAHYR